MSLSSRFVGAAELGRFSVPSGVDLGGGLGPNAGGGGVLRPQRNGVCGGALDPNAMTSGGGGGGFDPNAMTSGGGGGG